MPLKIHHLISNAFHVAKKNTSKRIIPYYDVIMHQIKPPNKQVKLFVGILISYKACHNKQTKTIKVEIKYLILFKYARLVINYWKVIMHSI